MKYVILLGDGMADRPLKELAGKSLLQACNTPNMDRIAREGCGGLVQTIPESCAPGSDVANLSILGYDPTQYYTGRAPLEAVSMGKAIGPDDVAFRCNLVTVDNAILSDYSAGHITTEEAHETISFLKMNMQAANIEFVPGVSYRHLMVFRNAPEAWRKGKLATTPPHDFTGQEFASRLPQGPEQEILLELMDQSRTILSDCPVNVKRKADGKSPASMIWLWGHGGAVQLPSIPDKWKIEGAVISAVDLIKGIGTGAGLSVEEVEGATGYIDTNYAGKVEHAIRVLREKDFVFVHVEAPDEAGHSGNWEIKKQAIEDFDAKIVGPVLDRLKEFNEFRVMVLPDHATPIETKTHARDAVPFAIYPSLDTSPDNMQAFNEDEAGKGSYQIKDGSKLFGLFKTGKMKTASS